MESDDVRHARTPYDGARVILLTRHGKKRVLAPLFQDRLAATLEVVEAFDTDTLGTFTRDIPREGSQLEAARRKAKLAIELTGASLGLGSEGALIPGPLGLGNWHRELVVLLDLARGIEVVGRAHGPGVHGHGVAHSVEELEALARRIGFPEHGLVIRPDGPDDRRLWKGLATTAQLHAAFDAALAAASTGQVFVETDLRAHHHPTRLAVIARAGADLVERMATVCPACSTPGVGVHAVLPGLPCAACGTATDVARADLLGCVRCAWREERPRTGPGRTGPSHCPSCNP